MKGVLSWLVQALSCRYNGKLKETRKGVPLLNGKTVENGDSNSTNERGPFLVGSLGLSCRYKRFLS